MKKKLSALVVSFALIAVCVSLIAGATFALFTSESGVSIVASSAKVKIGASVENVATKSLNSAYAAGAQNACGTVSVEDGVVTLDKIVPGDGVKFDLVIANESNITVKYRTLVQTVTDSGLAAGLTVKVNGQAAFDGFTKVSAWTSLDADVQLETVSVEIEFVEDETNNLYQDKACTLSYKIEAVQGNATTEDAEEGVFTLYTAHDLVKFAESVNAGTSYSGKTVVLANDVDMNGIEWVPIGVTVASYPGRTFHGTFDGKGHTIKNLKTAEARKTNADTWACDGLFGSVCGKIRNVTLDNAFIQGTHYVGGIVGYSSANVGMAISNCHVTNSTIISQPVWMGEEYDNGDKVGGIVGYFVSGDIVENCSVSNTSVRGYRDIGGIVGCGDGTVDNCTVSKVDLTMDKATNSYGKKDLTIAVFVGRTASATIVDCTEVLVTRTLIVNSETEQSILDNAALDATLIVKHV